MSKREQMNPLEEFRDPCDCDPSCGEDCMADAHALYAMADEIVRLRRILDALVAESVRTMADEIATLREKLATANQDLEYDDVVINGQAKLLTGAVNAIRGEPEPLAMHSHHDVVELVQDLVRSHQVLRHRAERAERILAALRDPSEAVVVACARALRQRDDGVTWDTWDSIKYQTRQQMMEEARPIVLAAVAAAEQEKSTETPRD